MDQLAPEVREALVTIQRDLFLNISIHQFLVAKVEKCTNEFDKNDLLEHKNDIECKIKILDQKQKKLLAVVRNTNIAKSGVNQSKEDKISITSPDKKHKLIDYGSKRPFLDDGLCPEPLKKRRVSKKLDAGGGPLKTRGERAKKARKDNCFTEDEEANLRALGCFYVFSHQKQLTRPLTEQDYFLMNFGLVSRDHIQYAPYGISSNVRRTRRQVGNKPKYKSSEWETDQAKKPPTKLPKGKLKEAEKSPSSEEVPDSSEQKGNFSVDGPALISKGNDNYSADTESPSLVNEVLYNEETNRLLAKQEQATSPHLLNSRTESDTIYSEETKTDVKTESEELIPSAQENSTGTNGGSEIQSDLKSVAERMPGSISSSTDQICNDRTTSNGNSFCSNSSENVNPMSSKDSVPVSEATLSQDSGISVHSNASEGSVMNLCPTTGYSFVSSRDLVDDENNSSDESMSLEMDLLLPDSVLQEHTEIAVECKNQKQVFYLRKRVDQTKVAYSDASMNVD